jgi:hypothetical protein
MRRLALLVLVTAPVLLFPARLRAQEETDVSARLKRVGVSGELNESITQAVNRGVTYLCKAQDANGGFGASPGGVRIPARVLAAMRSGYVGHSLLCALALAHAGTDRARAAEQRCSTLMFDVKSQHWKRVTGNTYHAGIALMLIAAGRRHRTLVEHLTRPCLRDSPSRAGGGTRQRLLGQDLASIYPPRTWRS